MPGKVILPFKMSGLKMDWSLMGENRWVWIHVILGVMHTVMGAAVIGDSYMMRYIQNSDKTIVISYANITTSSSPSKYSAALNARDESEYTRFKLSPIMIHAVVSIITGFSHMLSGWVYRMDGGVCLSEPNYIRWGEYAITASLMSISGLVSLGFTDAIVLISFFMVGVGIQLCGLFMEATKGLSISKIKNFKEPKMLWWYFFYLGCIMQLSITIPITVWTATADPNRPFGLWWAWLIYVVYYLLFPINAVYDAMRVPRELIVTSEGTGLRKLTAFSYTDKRYIILSFCSKISLYWITVASLMYNMTEDNERDSWYAVVFIACVVPALLTAFWLVWSLRRSQEIYADYKEGNNKGAESIELEDFTGGAGIKSLIF